jgi:hypothetical protein
MISLRKTSVWLFVVLFGLSSAAMADKNKNQKEIDAKRAKRLEQLRLDWAAAGKTYGSCQQGISFKDLDINSVRARLYNMGGLFYNGGSPLYNVPQAGSGNSIYAAGIWIGGLVDGELRMVSSDYGPWELWPGPLDDNGNSPVDCSVYDRMYKVSRQDILNYQDTGVATRDLADWPFDLGAPVVDGDGDPTNYNLAGGDRPDILGDQGIWWIMNDMGNEHSWSLTQPIGLEVQVLAFAFKRADALNNTTFYKYKLVNKGGQRLTETYFGIWVDPDLGDSGDDYVGSDTTRGIGFVWNGDDFDAGSDGYADRPPALGYDFFQGPVVDEDGNNVGATKFVYYNNDSTVQGNPDAGEDAYRYLRGLWRDDSPITLGGTGRGFSDEPVDFMFAGDPPEYWSEENTDGAGSRNAIGDRRFLMSSGPFTLEPGAQIDIVYGIVWSQAGDRFASVQQMKTDDALAQAAFNVNFQLPPPPDAPRVDVSELDGQVVLKWFYNPSDNNYLDSYDVFNPFLEDVDVEDKTYTFEGYNVYQYSSENDLVGRRIATYDLDNGITNIVDVTDATLNIPQATISAFGTDSGIRHSIAIGNQTNYTDLYFGVQAYAYNENSAPFITKSAVTRVVARPSAPLARNGGMVIDDLVQGSDIPGESIGAPGDGGSFARVIDPAAVTGHEYRVEFFQYDDDSDPEHPVSFTTYNIVDHTTGEIKVDGQALAETQGVPAKQVIPVEGEEPEGVAVVDGLDFKILGPSQDFKLFAVTANGAGPIDPPEAGSFGFQSFPTPLDADGELTDPTDAQQIGEGHWAFHAGGGGGGYSDFTSRAITSRGGWGPVLPKDFEMRFTYDDDNYAWMAYSTESFVKVPFELWYIGIDTPDDPSDDYRLFPFVLDEDDNEEYNLQCADHPGSSAENDPYTDWTYWRDVFDKTPGESGYLDVVAQFQADPTVDGFAITDGEIFGRSVLVNWNGGDIPDCNFNQDMPEQGTVFQLITNKVNQPTTLFSINSDGYQPVAEDQEAAEEALDLMAVVPNPYKGASNFELSNLQDVVRFTNMPQEATIRVFTLAGTLVRTIIKSGPSTSIDWDLQTEEGLPIASGMYLVHVEVPNVGEKVIKFGVVKKRIQLDLL